MWTSGLPLDYFSWYKFVVGIALISLLLQLKLKRNVCHSVCWNGFMIFEFLEPCKSGSNMNLLLCKTPCICEQIVMHSCHAMHFKILHLDYVYLLFLSLVWLLPFLHHCHSLLQNSVLLLLFLCFSSYRVNRFDLFSETCCCIRDSVGVDFDFIMNENNHFNADISQFLPYTSVVPIRKITTGTKYVDTETICVMFKYKWLY